MKTIFNDFEVKGKIKGTGIYCLYEFTNSWNGITIVEKMIGDYGDENHEYVKVLFSTELYHNSIGTIFELIPECVIKEDIDIGNYAHHFI